MASSKANCAICGKPLVYVEQVREVICSLCGKPDVGHSLCEDGHYVCDVCHRAKGVDSIISYCMDSESVNPVQMAFDLMRDDAIYPNGPEHHSLVGAVLLTAYKNAGGDLELAGALSELRARSMQIPGGTCGYWGVCGAAASAGQFCSIANGATPLSEDAWASSARLTSAIISRLAEIGGPRCCKRTSFVSIEEGAHHAEREMGVKMDLPQQITCMFVGGNAQCKKGECPFYPKRQLRPLRA